MKAESCQTSFDQGRTEHYFRRACASRLAGEEEKHRKYQALFLDQALGESMSADAPNEALAAMLYSAGEHEAVLEIYERFAKRGPGDTLSILAASIYFARKEPLKALEASEHINDPEERLLRRKTAELWSKLHAPLESEPRVHLLILTHNREAYVAEALRQLAMTDYSNYAVYIADNGSTDATLERVHQALSFFPSHIPVSVQSFPVNIGRPAGHNWLLGGHDHSKADFIAIGDDDLVRVPPDWLANMIKTARAFPGCGCVGGKSLTPGWPASVHGSVHRYFLFGPEGIRLTNVGEHSDIGQFDYVDKVDHVIGCLHIYDRAVLDKIGMFDIRLSPCQMVDVEHHLRMAMAGYPIIYNGLISFEHLRAMGVKAKKDRSLGGNSFGNTIKILYKYEHDEVNKAIAERHEERKNWLLA